MNKERVIVADESLYKTWICLDLDIAGIETVEQRLGSVIATNEIADSILRWLRRPLSSELIIVWKQRVTSDNVRYLEMTQQYSLKKNQARADIKRYTKTLFGLLQTLDRGVSLTDVSLLANAQWIGLNTPFEPVVVTEDRDLLGFGHIVSSCLGLPLGFLSLFEVLRSTGMEHILPLYFRHCDIPLTTAIEMRHPFSRGDLERDINALTRKTKIAFHPTLRRGDSIRRITRQTRRS